jgi:glycosyltransferase involved in cell wall biosynthesis
VLYNTNETKKIIDLSLEECDSIFNNDEINICVVGKISLDKGCDRVVRIQKRLREENFNTHIYFLGTGPEENFVTQFSKDNNLEDTITLLGYQTNPYKYVKKCDLFICASHAEGFSTATTEALIVGTPVVTVSVSGMKEMLGENKEYGIVTDNDEDALFEGIKKMISTKGMLEKYALLAQERGKYFSTENTVMAVEKMLLEL